MNRNRVTNSRNHGSGLIDLLVVLATLTLLVTVALPAIATRPKIRAQRISCISNLKCIGLSARMWSNDHSDVFPWNVSMTSNGVMEIATSGDVAALFRCMTNELIMAKILRCPADTARKQEVDFSKLRNQNISYFVGLDADETKPQTILFGDRNISGGTMASTRVMYVTRTNTLIWEKDIHYGAGNVALGDGSAQQISQAGLQRHFQSLPETVATVRLALP